MFPLRDEKERLLGTARYGDYILIYSGLSKDQRAQAGVGMLIHEQLHHPIQNIEYDNEELLQTTMKLDKGILHIISVYAPDISKPKEIREQFYLDLQDLLDQIPHRDQICIMGDFNADIGNEEIAGIK